MFTCLKCGGTYDVEDGDNPEDLICKNCINNPGWFERVTKREMNKMGKRHLKAGENALLPKYKSV